MFMKFVTNPHSRYSPPPNDIIWENLSDKRHLVNLKKLIANLFIFIVAFFLTTPQLIVHQLDPIIVALKNLTGDACAECKVILH